MEEHPTITIATTRPLEGKAEKPIEIEVPRELGPVRLIREVGRGGMGVVWLARHDLLGRDVAVKFLLHAGVKEGDSTGLRTLMEGTRAAAAVEHEALTTVHHADTVDGLPYVVLEYVDGPALSEVLKRRGGLPLATALTTVRGAAEGVERLHSAQIVHRDIKPGNIMLRRDGRIVVTDFGLACNRPAHEFGVDSGLAGTPAYMSPEMFDEVISTRSDVYALGIMLFELLTGQKPFVGNLQELKRQHAVEALPVALLKQTNVPQDVIEIIERATHKNHLFRFKTAKQFLQAVDDAIGGIDPMNEGLYDLQKCVAAFANVEDSESSSQASESADDSVSTYFDRLAEIADRKRGKQDTLNLVSVAEPTPVDRVKKDVPCAGCGYNLRTLAINAQCPECYTSIARSIVGDTLDASDPRWLAKVYRGQSLIWTGMVGLIVLLILSMGLVWMSLISVAVIAIFGVVIPILFVAAWVAIIVGFFNLTASDPRASLNEQPLSLRHSLLTAAIASGALLCVGIFLDFPLSVFGTNATVSAVITRVNTYLGGALVIWTVVLFCRYQAYLCKRVPDVTRANKIRTTGHRWAISLLIALAAGYFGGPIAIVSPSIFTTFCSVLSAVMYLIVLVYSVKIMSNVELLRRLLRDSLQQAHNDQS